MADAGADVLRSQGIGPLSKWVDDHFFIHILQKYLAEYNHLRRTRAITVERNGGRLVEGGRYWYHGSILPNDHVEEFDEDFAFPIIDLSSTSPRSRDDACFTYCFNDIDRLSHLLGIPWEPTKDIPFSACVPFIGFLWNLDTCTVSIPKAKREKYLAAIQEWEEKTTHALQETQQLHGKLLHASFVLPAGKAYLVSLETMLSLYGNCPHMPRTPPKDTSSDLHWWKARLAQPNISRTIPGPVEVTDFSAYSDASSGTGIAIWINGTWRAWRLLPGWNTDGLDIGWAEAIGMEFLTRSLLTRCTENTCLKIYGDNRGVVKGWWKGRSRNKATNSIFKHIHKISAAAKCTILTRYIPSAHNPADDPSHGKYPPPQTPLTPNRHSRTPPRPHR